MHHLGAFQPQPEEASYVRHLCVPVRARWYLFIGGPVFAADGKPGPADGFDIHVMAPHKMEDGSVAGPFHHYWQGHQAGSIAVSAV